MKKFWLISEIWVDSMENRNAWGYAPLGVTDQESVMLSYKNAPLVEVEDKYWPYKYINDGKAYARYIIKELSSLGVHQCNKE